MRNAKILQLIVYSLLILVLVLVGYALDKKNDTDLKKVARQFEFEQLPVKKETINKNIDNEQRYVASNDLTREEKERGIEKIKKLSGDTDDSSELSVSDLGDAFNGVKEKVKNVLNDFSLSQNKNQEDNDDVTQKEQELLQIEKPLLQTEEPCGANDIPGQQCGGGTSPLLPPVGECKAQTVLAFDYVCNYGNYPQTFAVPEPQGNISCSSVVACGAPCSCGVLPSICGPTIRCQFLGSPCTPVTCEQCCTGSAWLWDSVTGWCGCAR